ncbi:MAG TPA: FecR domain-containing protein [Puia sp.]|jgi:ferric-dicitrate binding protein FerR (iron transport regulator)
MTRLRFEYLFGLYKANQLSQEEWDELRHAIGEGQHEDWLNEDFLQLLRRGGMHETWTPGLEEAMWKDILNGRIPAEQLTMRRIGKDKSPLIGRRIVRFGVAAAILLAVIGGWRLFFRQVSHNPAPVASKHKTENNVRPGRDRALLTLPDGTRIDLDSARNGQIATQGAAVFSKSNGALSIFFAGTRQLSHPTGNEQDPAHPEAAGEAFISTPRGGQYQLILPDGSKVWLNSSSSLRFPTVFKGKQRSVELSGEGYFEIAKNAAMPFSVKVNGMQVRVLGTHFNTMAYPDEKTINTTLLEGAVEVSSGDLSKRLAPGQQAALNNAGHQLAVGQADIQKAVAWKNGLFEFDHTDLATIMRQLARWYDIEIVYQAMPDKTPLGGSISKNLGLTEVLELLEANGINHFKIEGKKVFVLP